MGTVVELKRTQGQGDEEPGRDTETAEVFERLARDARAGKIASTAGFVIYHVGDISYFAAGNNPGNTTKILKAAATLLSMLVV